MAGPVADGPTARVGRLDGFRGMRLVGASKTFPTAGGGRRQALAPIDLEIPDEQFVCVVGSSGCGKSTLLSLMGGYEKPTTGSLQLHGVEISGPSVSCVTVFQDYGLFPWRSVLGNIEYGLQAAGVARTERRARATRQLEAVGLGTYAKTPLCELSGGMRQRVNIARALAVKPETLLMDEPFGALDAITRMRMQDELVDLWRDERRMIVFVTHDVDEAIYLADRIVLMGGDPGRISEILDVGLTRPRQRNGEEFFRLRSRILEKMHLASPPPVLEYDL